MKRTTLMAALTGAAVLLAGCSSTGGTAAPASTSSSSAAATSSAMSSMSSAPAPAGSAAASITEPSSSASSSSAPSSSAASSETASSASSTSSEDSTASSAPSTKSSASTSKAPTTVGNTSGGLDVKSAAWMSTFCGGLQPVADLAKDTKGISGSDPAAVQKTLVGLYGKLGSSFTDTAKKLKPLPAPTFAGGDAFAGKVVTALGTAGPTFSSDAKKLAAIDVKKDPSAFSKALQGVSKDLGTATGPLQELNSLKLTPQTQAAFEKLPACAKLKAGATG